MLTQKLYKNGNSVVVTIPEQYLKELNLMDGSIVVVNKKGKDFIVTPKSKKIISDVDQNFAKIVDEFIEDHKDVLQELSQR